MSKKAQAPSLADLDAAPGGVSAVDRALSLLTAFRHGDGALTLAELAVRTKLYKSTILRLLASLEHARLVARKLDGSYTLGPEIARLHKTFTTSFSLEGYVIPVLRELVATTRESAAFHVRQGDERLCLYRVDSPQIVRDHIRAGDLLPLNRGAGGRVLTAYSGAKGPMYDEIRSQGFVVLDGDRVAELTGISAPVFDSSENLVGVVTLTMPSPRMQKKFVGAVRRSAAALTSQLGGFLPAPPP